MKCAIWIALLFSVVVGFNLPLPAMSPEDACATYIAHQLEQIPKGQPTLIPSPAKSYAICVEQMKKGQKVSR